MGNFRIAGILVLVVLGLISGLVSAETLYRPDSTKVEFTMGCCWNTSQYHPEVLDYLPEVSFEPLFIIPGIETTDVIENGLNDSGFVMPPYGPPYYIPYKDSFVNENIIDRIGDTVLVIWYGGTFRGVIKDIGLYYSAESMDPICRIEAIGIDLINEMHVYNTLVVVRNQFSYQGPNIHFESCELTDSLEYRLADSLEKAVASAWAVSVESLSYIYSPKTVREALASTANKSIECYKRVGNTNPDTAFWIAYFDCGSAAPDFMIYRIIKKENKLVSESLLPYGQSGAHFALKYAIDLDDNGYLEFIVNYFDGICNDAELLELKDGKLNHITFGFSEVN